jgi:hypothetical protein
MLGYVMFNMHNTFVSRVPKGNLEYLDFQELTVRQDTLEILECLVLKEILVLQGLKDL